MKIKITKKKENEIIKNRLKMILDSGREVDIEQFAKNLGKDIIEISKIVSKLITQYSEDYQTNPHSIKKYIQDLLLEKRKQLWDIINNI